MAKGYESIFRSMLRRAGARQLEKGVHWLLVCANTIRVEDQLSEADALMRVYRKLSRSLRSRPYKIEHPRFHCDAGLGGLARWLRASGYEALWRPDIDDHELLRAAKALACIVLTTDSMMMERRALRDGTIPTLWLPPNLTAPEQLQFVFREFGLGIAQPRCMSCGGQLRQGDKQALQAQIPPRTFRWLDHYFVCERCHKLFWHGTHWSRIRQELEAAVRGIQA